MKSLTGYGILIVLWGLLGMGATNAQEANNALPPSGGTGNSLNYPVGTRIYQGGIIVPPRGRAQFPNNTIRHGDGSTTFYYPNGTRVTTRKDTIAPSGTFLSPGVNGGLRNDNLNRPRLNQF